MKRPERRRKPLGMLIIDILLTCAALLVFATFHHVIPAYKAKLELKNTPPEAVQPVYIPPAAPNKSTPAETEDTPEEEPEPADRFAEFFTDQVVVSEDGYSSPNICIKITHDVYADSKYTVADIYLRDARCLRSYFAGNRYIAGSYGEKILSLTGQCGAILAVNGDCYSHQDDSCVVRDGVTYRLPVVNTDMCLIYEDGTMATFRPGDFSSDDELAAALDNCWQCWSFGPVLLDGSGNARPDASADTTAMIAGKNPRTGIGYYEPLHYCFVVVDGRQNDSAGITIDDFAQLFVQLGCSNAYNLDGGGSSYMVFNGEMISSPFQSRDLTDILYIGEPAEEASEN